MAQSNKPNLRTNVLHNFQTVNALFTLSGLNEQEFKNQKFLTNPVHEIIARTGGIGEANVKPRKFDPGTTGSANIGEQIAKEKRYNEAYGDSINILERGHDLFIENVNMISTVGPNNERSLGNFTKMEFEIVEPFGITFIEKVRAATAINGFLDYQDAPLLLTIEFKGNVRGDGDFQPVITKQETGEMVRINVRKIPILIARVDFDVTEAGAKYSVVAVPYTDLAHDDRFKYPRTVLTTQVDDIETFLIQTELQLQKQIQTEIDDDKTRTLPDIYSLNVEQEVRDFGRKYDGTLQSTNQAGAVGDQEVFYDQDTQTNLKTRPTARGAEASANGNVAITKYMEDAVRSMLGYQELANDFWTAYLRGAGVKKTILDDKEKKANFIKSDEFKQTVMKNQYVDWFKIKTTVETPDGTIIDPITKMSPKIIKYTVVPYKIHILKFMPPGVSLGNIDWSKKVSKEYDFIYTGDNVDVQGLRINYKTAYYLRNVRGDDRSGTDKGWFSEFFEGFKEIFGREQDPEPLLPLRQYPSAITGNSTMRTNTGSEQKAQQFYDYLTHPEVDMMKIELDILGDPAYLCQDMYLPIKTGGTVPEPFDDGTGSFNADSFQPIINVRYRLPDDIDENKGTMFSEGLDGKALFRDENLFFNGLYQVNKIESKFDQGQFLQTLYCSRFNNQQGSGAPPVLVSSATKGLTEMNQFEENLKGKINNSSVKSVKDIQLDAYKKELEDRFKIDPRYKNLQPK
jgi:hypothetical protein